MALKRRDFVVVGGGIVGLSVARELRRRRLGSVSVVEKEAVAGAHASGRNSGVLHAGFYYSPDSLKARFTRAGNARLTEYCLDRGLPLRRCGKLVLPQNQDELARLDELFRRGTANGVVLQMLDATQAREIEPRARVHERAIWSPATSAVDPLAVMQALHRDAVDEGIEVLTGVKADARPKGNHTLVEAGETTFEAGFLINAAGLQADLVARRFGLARHYAILPFRGRYLYSDEPPGALRTHLYPVPDPRFPFLGVHFTITVDGRVKIGPTAAPALWREHYGGVSNFESGEAFEIVTRGLGLIRKNKAVRAHAIEELRKNSRAHMVAIAARLAEDVSAETFREWGKPGLRAQLYDTRSGQLEMDFVIERGERSLHILNAVSPGFTCALPFAEHVVDQIAES